MTSLAGSFAFDEAATERYRRFGLPHQYWRAFPVYRFEAVMGSRPLLPRMRPANKVLYLYFLPPTGSDNTLIGAAAPLHGFLDTRLGIWAIGDLVGAESFIVGVQSSAAVPGLIGDFVDKSALRARRADHVSGGKWGWVVVGSGRRSAGGVGAAA